jgi:hypothetical protein
VQLLCGDIMVSGETNTPNDSSSSDTAPDFLVYTADQTILPIELKTPTHVMVATPVRQISNGAFCQANGLLLSIVMPNGLERIGDRSFFQCHSLLTLNIPSSLVQVGLSAFTQCTRLGSVDFSPDSQLQMLGNGCFSHCQSLHRIQIPPSVTSLGRRAFCNCDKLISMDLSHCLGLRRIENQVFFSCSSLRKVNLPCVLNSIGNGAFGQCYELRSFRLGTPRSNQDSSLISIGDQAFASCRSLRSIQLPKSLRTIGKFAFANCFWLVSVEFAPDIRLQNVGDQIFFGCKNLVNILLPETIAHTTILGQDIFKDCQKLKERFAPIQDETNEIFLKEALSIRYHGLSLHHLCYHQGHYSIKDTMEQFEAILEDRESQYHGRTMDWTRWIDMFGMSPLHILVVSSEPNPKLLEAIIRHSEESKDEHMHHTNLPQSVSPLLTKDIWGDIPLFCACLSDAAIEIVEVLLQYHATNDALQLEPDDWDACIDAALSNSAELVCVLVQARMTKRLHYLGLPKWRDDMIREIAKIAKEQIEVRRRKIRMVELKLQDYEQQESIALVRLAVWKVKLDQLPLEEKYLTHIRNICWFHCGDQVIISNVLPFVGFIINR